MLSHHQPTIFGPNVITALSSKSDGNMKFGLDDDDQVVANRRAFLQSVGIQPENTTLVGITYATDDFTKYRSVATGDKTRGMLVPQSPSDAADALVVNQPNHALFLPLADCIGAVLYDPRQHVLMVSHLGRHSVEINGAHKSVDYLVQHYGVNPADVKVWLSPGVGRTSYPLHAFGGQSLREVILAQLKTAGVDKQNIESSSVDTAQHPEYYSHSEYLKGNEDGPARFAIVAMMTAQGEPAD